MTADLEESERARRLAVVLATIFVAMLGTGVIAPLLPLFAKSLGATGVMLGAISGGFSLVRAVSMPVVGSLSDRHGRRPFLLLGLATYALMSIAYIRVDTAWGLIAVRSLHGLCSAMVIPVAAAYVGDIAGEGREGAAMGSFHLALLLGFGAGPLMGGAMQDRFGFASTFLVMAALSAAACLLAALLLREPPERGARAPTRAAEVLASARARTLLLFRLLLALGQGAVASFLPVYAGLEAGLSATRIGVLVSANILLAGALQPLCGRLSDRLPKAPLLLGGAATISAAFLGMAYATDFRALFLCALGMSVGTATALSAAAALAVIEGRRIGMGAMMGLFNTAMSLGIGTGAVAGGLVADGASLRAVFVAAAATTLGGALLCYGGLREAPVRPVPLAEEALPEPGRDDAL